MATVHRLLVPALLLVVLGVPTTSAPAGAVAPPGGSGTDPVGVWPLRPEPEVVRALEPPPSPYGAGHRGVDLAGRPGQPVRTALAGRVAFAGSIAGRGVVVVSHGATRTTYEPVAASVTVGTLLARGAPLGILEAGGSHCFPAVCLHWGWIAGETYLDPLRLVGLWPVRLLPLWREDPLPADAVAVPALRLAGALAGRPVAAGRW